MKKSIIHKFKSLQEKYIAPNKTLNILIIILLYSNFLLLGIDGINTARDPEAWDTTAYLGEANFVHNYGGVPGFLNLCLTGRYTQANQHPLYILLLTPFASTNISFFIVAKIISFLIGLIFLVVLYFIAKKMFGNLVGFVAVFGLVLNILFIKWTTLVACESLLILFSLICMYCIIEGFNNNKYWAYAGIFAGLAYLTKGTSLILLPGFGLAAIVIYKFGILKNKYFWSFFLLFIFISSPLLIRNIIVYKNPFFNVNNYIITYGKDHIDENMYVIFSPDEGATLWKFDKSEVDSAKPKSSDNSFFDLLPSTKKLLSGVWHEVETFLSSFNVVEQHFRSSLNWIWEILLFLFLIIGLSRSKNNGGKIYFTSTLLVFFVILSFNPIDRYFLPLVPLIWIYVAYGIFTIIDFVNNKILLKYPKFNLISYIPYVLVLMLLIYSGINLTKKTLSNPFNSVEYSESRLELLTWLRTNLQENEKYTLGPNFNWQLKTGTWILAPDNVQTENLSRFQSFLRKHDVTYIIMVPQRLDDMVEIRQYFGFDPSKGLFETKPIDGWSLVYADQSAPVDFLVYKLN